MADRLVPELISGRWLFKDSMVSAMRRFQMDLAGKTNRRSLSKISTVTSNVAVDAQARQLTRLQRASDQSRRHRTLGCCERT